MENKNNDRRSFLSKTGIFAAGLILFSAAKSKLFGKVVKSPSGSRPSDTPYIGEIALYTYNFIPTGWQECNGALLPISEYDALFALIGTTYGGDGQTTFAVPDLRGRLVVKQGTLSGGSTFTIGESAGSETGTVNSSQIPIHTHNLAALGSTGTTNNPAGNFPALDSDGIAHYSSTANTTGKIGAISTTGSSISHNNMQPFLGLRYCISLYGIFPSQS